MRDLYTGFQGIAEATIVNQRLNRVYVTPAVTDVSISSLYEEALFEARSRQGHKVTVGSYIDASQPIVDTTFPTKTPALLAAATGLKIDRADTLVHVAETIRVTGDLPGATQAGQEGWGMPPDQSVAKGSYLDDDGEVQELSRQPFDTFDPSTPFSFAQGANGATKFSDNLKADEYYVKTYYPLLLTSVLGLRGRETTNYTLNLMLVQTDRSIFHCEFRAVRPNLGQTTLNFGEANLSIQWRAIDDRSGCGDLFSITYLGQVTHCNRNAN